MVPLSTHSLQVNDPIVQEVGLKLIFKIIMTNSSSFNSYQDQLVPLTQFVIHALGSDLRIDGKKHGLAILSLLGVALGENAVSLLPQVKAILKILKQDRK